MSLTNNSASASGSKPRVADRCGWPWPPRPGVDERQPAGQDRAGRPHLDAKHRAAMGLGAHRSAQVGHRDVDRFFAAPAVGDDQPRLRLVGVRHHGHQHGARRRRPGRRACSASSELSSWLLPCLRLAAIATRIRGSVIAPPAESQADRSTRSLRSAMVLVWSINSTITGTWRRSLRWLGSSPLQRRFHGMRDLGMDTATPGGTRRSGWPCRVARRDDQSRRGGDQEEVGFAGAPRLRVEAQPSRWFPRSGQRGRYATTCRC